MKNVIRKQPEYSFFSQDYYYIEKIYIYEEETPADEK